MLRFLILLIVSINFLNAIDSKRVTLQLSWFNQFQFAGYIIAKEKGFYKDKGLDVYIKPFEFGIDVSKDVSDGKAQFGIGRETTILDKANKNRDNIVLFALFQSSPLILLSKKDSNIQTVNDFKDKKIMTTIDDASEVSLKAMITSHNLRLKDMTFFKHSHNINDLLDEKVDVISAYISKAPYELLKKRVPYIMFQPKDYGFDMYSDFLITNSQMIKSDIDTVRAFKEASLEGWKYAYENIEESVNIILKNYNTQKVSKEELIFEANELKKLSFYKTNNLGNVDKRKLQRIHDLYMLMGLIKSNINFDEFIFEENKDFFKELIFSKEELEYLNNRKPLKLCTTPDWLPYDKITNYSYEGIGSSIISEIKKILDVKIEAIETKSWGDSLKKVKNRECDILPIAIDIKSRRGYLNFTEPYLNQDLVVATRSEQFFIKSASDLENSKVAILKNSAEVEILKKNYPFLNLVYVSSPEEGIKKVNEKEVLGYIDTLVSLAYNINKQGAYNLKVAGKLDINLPFSIATRSDEPILKEIFQKALNNIDKKRKDEILNTWVPIKYENGVDYTLTFQVIFIALGVISLLSFVIVRENRLKSKIKVLNLTLENRLKEIDELNKDLEVRVEEEVEKNREKDNALFRQSKLASMGEMIGNIAHQWRQPLNRINLSLQIIDDLVKEDKIDKDFIDRKIRQTEKNIHYMSDTIEDFINFFNPDKKKESFCTNEVIQKAIKLVENRAFDINFDIDMNGSKAVGFRSEFLQVLLIILNNAIDNFNINEIEDRKVYINQEDMNDKVKISIKDNGGGIKPEFIEKIFEPYFTTKFKKEGTGLGLYVAKMLIEKSMEGEMYAHSKDGFAEFEIILVKDKDKNG